MVTRIAKLKTNSDASIVVDGLRKRFSHKAGLVIWSSSAQVRITHKSPRLGKDFLKEIQAFIDGYKIAKEFS